MQKRTIILSIMTVLLSAVGVRAQVAPVAPTWESLNQRGYPEWFSDAKLGIFIHWGLYSVPAYASKEGYGEWFYRGLMLHEPGRMAIMSLYADTTMPAFNQYAELTKHWHAELWKPEEWSSLFKKAGAKYVVLVTKHHDGYCLWDSPQQPQWNSTVSGPRRNIVDELTAAVRRDGLRMGFYYSLPEWTNPRHIWMEDPDDSISDYVDNYMVPQFKELVSRYKPDLIFSDGDWNNTSEQLRSKELISWYYNTVGADAVVNNRWGNGTRHGFLTPEYSAGIKVTNTPWAECRGIGRSFGLNRNEDLENFLSDKELVQHFVELVANGGGLILNVGPDADGTIPFIQQERLIALGRWLETNGEAIYGSRPYISQSQFKRFTAKLPTSDGIDFDWVRNSPINGVSTDNFNIHWSGTVTAPADGKYTFVADADDEMTVLKRITYSTDTLLHVSKDASKPQLNQTTIFLEKDEKINLEVYYSEKDLEATASLKWSHDGGEIETVPATWDGEVSWEQTTRCFTTNNGNLYVLEFQRPDRNKPLVIHGIPNLKSIKNVTLLGSNGILKWKLNRKGDLTIDFSRVSLEDMNRLEHVWCIRIEN